MLRALLVLSWSAWACAFAQVTAVTLVLSDTAKPYQQAADALRGVLERSPEAWRVSVQTLAGRGPGGDEDLVITLGLKALRGVLAEDRSTPVWSLLVPRQTFEQIAATQTGARRRSLSALYLDLPLARHFLMLGNALPKSRRLGVLLGPSSAMLSESLIAAAEAARYTLIIEPIRRPEDLIPSLDKLEGEVDALLLIPDPVVLNRASLQALLLHTYHLRLPVVAYSAQLIDAGAMLALYTTPSQIGAEAGERLRQARSAGGLRLPPPGYPASFDVAVNQSVAMSLGIQVPSSEQLRSRMTQVLERP